MLITKTTYAYHSMTVELMTNRGWMTVHSVNHSMKVVLMKIGRDVLNVMALTTLCTLEDNV